MRERERKPHTLTQFAFFVFFSGRSRLFPLQTTTLKKGNSYQFHQDFKLNIYVTGSLLLKTR
ncbi:hypothetical protein EXN66_Car019611 [Channa argus]|uniref:Uncharacterized protein n=1 Tax=Channa argus TaxID=215402 RepID=A0A6G1QNQ2_CHAAH|nr:hypothetical protein EXN66_Car019611 [Channa argus]